MEHQDLADQPRIEFLANEIDHRLRRPLHADLHDEAGLLPDAGNLQRFLDRAGHRLFAVDVLAGIERIDDLLGMPVIGRADADRVQVLFGEHVAVIDVLRRVVAVLLLDVVGDHLTLVVPDLGNGGNFDVSPFVLELAERFNVCPEAAATGADHADADPLVGITLGLRGSGQSG